MNDLLSPHAIDKMVLLFMWIAFAFLFWVFEAVWHNDKRWVVPILICPPVILGFIVKYWEKTRARCFFIGLYVVTLVLLGGVTGYSFVSRLGVVMLNVVAWPYWVYMYFA